MADATIGIKIPEQLIEDTIRAQMVRELSRAPQIVESIINGALTEKEHSYGSVTKFQSAVASMIRSEAQKVVEEWIEENRKTIRDTFIKKLTSNRKNYVGMLADQMLSGLTEKMYLDVKFDVKRSSDD